MLRLVDSYFVFIFLGVKNEEIPLVVPRSRHFRTFRFYPPHYILYTYIFSPTPLHLGKDVMTFFMLYLIDRPKEIQGRFLLVSIKIEDSANPVQNLNTQYMYGNKKVKSMKG